VSYTVCQLYIKFALTKCILRGCQLYISDKNLQKQKTVFKIWALCASKYLNEKGNKYHMYVVHIAEHMYVVHIAVHITRN
jgi:hypothetical protein